MILQHIRGRRGINEGKRETGIDVVGDIPWGMHICLFYETEQDLFDVLAPYFKAGLENNELCMCINRAQTSR